VLRREPTPLIAVVRLRKRDEWVLPKGKLDDGETPLAAAEREVIEETGHDVTVHEFLGTLVYEANGRSKVVHYWRMEACGGQTYELMNDIRAVDWLPLDAALERLSRTWERAFLANVGPQALLSLSLNAKAKAQAKAQAVRKRRSRTVATPTPSVPRPAYVESLPADVVPADLLSAQVQPALAAPDALAPPPAAVGCETAASDPVVETSIAAEPALQMACCDVAAIRDSADHAPQAEACAADSDDLDDAIDAAAMPAENVDAEPAPAAATTDDLPDRVADRGRWSLARKVRDWFGSAA